MAETAIIFNIQRYSVHDGSGIRTLVFIKGCPLRCEWCSNPESQQITPQLHYVSNKCAGDGDCRRRPCIESCPNGAIMAEAEGKVIIGRDKCDDCGRCVPACLWEALRLIGEETTVEEVIEKIERDRAFFDKSGGGVTLGGGEPMVATEFACALLERCKAASVQPWRPAGIRGGRTWKEQYPISTSYTMTSSISMPGSTKTPPV